MTRLSSIPDHHLSLECACTHVGLIPVAPILAKGDRTVEEVVRSTRCSRCLARNQIRAYRIIYCGKGDIAMRAGHGQMTD